MSGMDPALKPRLRRRSTFEYVAWVVCSLIGIGILISVSTNPNFKWGVVAKYFTHETIVRGLMLTIFLTLASMALGTLLGLALAVMRASSIKPVAATAGAYITLFRGTPVLVQLIFWFNVSALYPNLIHRHPVHRHRHRHRRERPDGAHHGGPGRPDPQ